MRKRKDAGMAQQHVKGGGGGAANKEKEKEKKGGTAGPTPNGAGKPKQATFEQEQQGGGATTATEKQQYRLEDDHTLKQLNDLIAQIESLQMPHKHQHVRFELLLLIYLLCHMLIQNYNIYRLNFYLYNPNLLILICIILCKRLLVRYIKSVKRENPFHLNSGAQLYFNLIILACILLNSFYQIYQLFMRHPFKNMLYLFYPRAVAYFVIFGISGNERMSEADMTIHRLKKIFYNTVECGYFAGFLPLKFMQNEYIFYDPFRCILLIVFVLANSFVMFFTHLLATSFCEIYIQAQTFGCWCVSRTSRSDKSTPNNEWDPKHGPYPRGAIVWHNGKEYIAIGLWNSSEPGKLKHRFIYLLFGEPDRCHTFLILIQGIIVISQLALVFNTSYWNVYGIMLLLNYYVFYLCLSTRRDNLQYFSYYPFQMTTPHHIPFSHSKQQPTK